MLIPNWRNAHKLLTVQLGAALVAWGLLPPDQQTAILAWIGCPAERVPAVMGVLVMAARLIAQPKAQ